MRIFSDFKGLFRTFSGIWVVRIVVSVAPHVNHHKVLNVRRNFASHDRCIAANHILVVGFDFVVLNDDFRRQIKVKITQK